jgi:cation transport ATPase
MPVDSILVSAAVVTMFTIFAVALSRGKVRHVFSVRQRLRPDAQVTVSSLQARGITVEIVSGDREPARAGRCANPRNQRVACRRDPG